MNDELARKRFLENQIMSASPGKLVLLLYDGYIKFCNIAKKAIDNKDYYEANENIKKAERIIAELQATLNFNYEVANDFNNIYSYILPRLIEANIKKDNNILEECIEHIRTLREAWVQVMKGR